MANEVYIVSAVRTPIGKHLKVLSGSLHFEKLNIIELFFNFY